ncbi:hypothetical protein CHISP_2941 [Chitinispirillum alkaliphilum]|nr:hypothetical protein CHISP_2941 [Chitinispirillum alkaliphilum]
MLKNNLFNLLSICTASVIFTSGCVSVKRDYSTTLPDTRLNCMHRILLHAAEENHHEIVAELLKKGVPSILPDQRQRRNPNSAFISAVMNGSVDAVEELLSFGIDIREWKAVKSLDIAMESNNSTLFTLLLDSIPEEIFKEQGSVTLKNAIVRRDIQFVSLLLQHARMEQIRKDVEYILSAIRPRNINSFTNKSAPNLTSMENDTKIVEMLLKTGFPAEPAIQDSLDTSNKTIPPLIMACKEKRSGIVKALLRAGVDVNRRHTLSSGYSTTALLEAVGSGCEQCVRKLIESGADIQTPNHNGLTPLILSSQKGYYTITQLLISADAELEHKYREENRPEMSALMYAALNGNEKCFKLLIDAGADTYISQAVKPSILFLAASGKNKEIIDLILDMDVDIAAEIDRDQSAITVASSSGHYSLVKALLEHGADPNSNHPEGCCPPLMEASFNGDYKNVELLVEYGADIHFRSSSKNRRCHTPLECALLSGNAEVVEKLLDYGCSLDSVQKVYVSNSYEINPFMIARVDPTGEIVSVLVEEARKQNAESWNDSVRILFHYAISKNLNHFFALINSEVPLDLIYHDGYTLLHGAAGVANAALCEYLLLNGADVNAENDSGITPLMWHLFSPVGSLCVTTILTLLEYGAKIDYDLIEHRDALEIEEVQLKTRGDVITFVQTILPNLQLIHQDYY